MSAAAGRLGVWGEDAAAHHLQGLGYQVLGRRVRTRCGELDLVALDGQTLVFVEVKAAARTRTGAHPGENVHVHKQRRLGRAAMAYLAGLDREPCCRFDVVTVLREPAQRVEHFAGAFSL